MDFGFVAAAEVVASVPVFAPVAFVTAVAEALVVAVLAVAGTAVVAPAVAVEVVGFPFVVAVLVLAFVATLIQGLQLVLVVPLVPFLWLAP